MTTVERIARLLEEKGIGNNEFDRMLGKTQGYTSTLLANPKRKPRPATLVAMARALDCSVDHLEGRDRPAPRGHLSLVTPAQPTPTPPPTTSRRVPRPDVVLDGRYANLDAAIELLADTVPATVLRSVRAGHDLKSDNDPSIEEWIEVIRSRYSLLKRAQQQIQNGDVPIDE
jgi:hypothetical protein